MKLSRIAKIGAIGAIAALALTACASNEGTPAATTDPSAAAPLSGIINGSGATSQQVAVQAWTATFQTNNPDVTVNYDPQGSGTGRESFQSGAVQFAGSDRAFKADEITAGPFDACVAGSTSSRSRPTCRRSRSSSTSTESTRSTSMRPPSRASSPAPSRRGTTRPSPRRTRRHAARHRDHARAPLRQVGTTGNFTDYLGANAEDVWTFGSVEEWPIQGGEAAQGTSGVVNAVKGGQGTIGYADSSQAGDLASVNVKVGDEFVGHSAEGAAIAVDASPFEDGRADTDLAITIDRTTTEAGAYPVVLISYLIGCAEYEDAATAELVKGFFSTAISEAGQEAAATNAGSAPISAALSEKSQTAVDAIK